jgi:hypothetical protein
MVHVTQYNVLAFIDVPQYLDDKHCRNRAALFLLIGGAVNLAGAIVHLIANCWFGGERRRRACWLSIQLLQQLCVVSWGSVIVFRNNFISFNLIIIIINLGISVLNRGAQFLKAYPGADPTILNYKRRHCKNLLRYE